MRSLSSALQIDHHNWQGPGPPPGKGVWRGGGGGGGGGGGLVQSQLFHSCHDVSRDLEHGEQTTVECSKFG